jgi:hypothetical protein
MAMFQCFTRRIRQMIVHQHLVFPAFLFLLASCSPPKPTTVTTIDILEGAKKEKEFRLSNLVDRVEYIKLETHPECLLSWANCQVREKYILATQYFDPAQIFLFDRSGRFLRKIGREGKGPGEYSSISAATSDPGENYILVNDYQRSTILQYDFSGKLVNSFNYKEEFDGNVAAILIKSPDEIFLRFDYPRMEKRNFYLIRKTDRHFHPLDSLYPVNTETIAGNGFSWGGSDFYLYEGNIRFRQFSFDTLFEASGKQMVPVYRFPIRSGHLPGPYLVSGLHKRMNGYNSILGIIDLPDYLLLNALFTDKRGGMMVFDKNNRDLFLLKSGKPCLPDTISRRVIINDIDGVADLSFPQIDNGKFVELLQMVDLKEKAAQECPLSYPVKFPAKRKEFLDIIGRSRVEDNPVLRLFYLK